MAEEGKNLLATFEAKLRQLMHQYEQLQHENESLKHFLAQKGDELKKLNDSKNELETMYIKMKVNFSSISQIMQYRSCHRYSSGSDLPVEP